MRRIFYLMASVLLLLSCGSSCQSHRNEAEAPQEPVLSVLSIQDGTRVHGTSWEAGDAIGVLAYPQAMEMGEGALHPQVRNLQMVTSDGNGHFRSIGGAVRIGKEEQLSIVAYYPYQGEVQMADLLVPIDVSNQNDPAGIDYLYARSATPVKATQPEAQLTFGRVMSCIAVVLEAKDGGDLSRARVKVEGLQTRAKLDLKTGLVTPEGEPEGIWGFREEADKATGATSRVTFTFIIPSGQSNKGATFTFEVNGKQHTHTVGVAEARKMQAGRTYTFPFVLNDSGSVTPPEKDNNIPKKAHYQEIPQSNPGIMPDAIYVMEEVSDSYFGAVSPTPSNGSRRNYTYAFSKERHQPYWVAYPLYPDCFGNSGRSSKWIPSPDVPTEFQPNLSRSYNGNYDRGHMLASSARTATPALNQTTFYYTNSIPQVSSHNQQVWQEHENFEKEWGKKNDLDTIYVVTGPLFEEVPTRYTSDRDGLQIPVPSHSWKVMLRYDRAKQRYFTLAVKIPNVDSKSRDWKPYVTTVKALEEELGLTFYNKLPPEVADEVKSQKDLSNW